jgi:hypothetical protein
MTTMDDLERLHEQVQRLQDVEDLREVTARYAMATNKVVGDIDVDALGSLFADDASWEARGQRVEGLGAIMEGLRNSTVGLGFAVHAYVNPVLTLDGDTASGRWVIQLVGRLGEAYHQGCSIQDFSYVRTSAGWRIKSVTMRPGAMFPLPPPVTQGPPRVRVASDDAARATDEEVAR